ncbi:MAG: hypothetical protein ACPG8W_23960 [Candidatus Promineifilaceae bacterium]
MFLLLLLVIAIIHLFYAVQPAFALTNDPIIRAVEVRADLQSHSIDLQEGIILKLKAPIDQQIISEGSAAAIKTINDGPNPASNAARSGAADVSYLGEPSVVGVASISAEHGSASILLPAISLLSIATFLVWRRSRQIELLGYNM